MNNLVLPDGFQLGVATSAQQVEGGLDQLTDYGAMASVPGGEFKDQAGLACDQFHRYPEDIRLMADMGLDAYRLGIEWARVEPVRGEFDGEAIEHYRQVLNECRANNITPVVTLHHFSSPRWLVQQGGWEWVETPALFATYARRIAQEFGDVIKGSAGQPVGRICTLNEVNTGRLNVIAAGNERPLDTRRQKPWTQEVAALVGVAPERFTPWSFASSDTAFDVIMDSHRLAIQAIKEVDAELQVGMTVASQDIEAVGSEFETEAARLRMYTNDQFLHALVGGQDDFIGIQSYTHFLVGERADGTPGILPPDPNKRLVDMGYAWAPEALEYCLRSAYELTQLPMVVTECGIGCSDDKERAEFFEDSLSGLARCLADGLPIHGWFAWSLLDNWEWERGHGQEFGVVAVDLVTQQRTPKPSAEWLRDMAKRREIRVL